MGIEDIKLVNLPKIADARGNLTFVQENDQVPFKIRRIYFLYDVPGGETRGGHAHKDLEQLILAAAGSFDVIVKDGLQQKRFHLNRSYVGLYIPRMIWRELDNFSSCSVCLVVASTFYAESDYIRDYDEFVREAKRQKGSLK